MYCIKSNKLSQNEKNIAAFKSWKICLKLFTSTDFNKIQMNNIVKQNSVKFIDNKFFNY